MHDAKQVLTESISLQNVWLLIRGRVVWIARNSSPQLEQLGNQSLTSVMKCSKRKEIVQDTQQQQIKQLRCCNLLEGVSKIHHFNMIKQEIRLLPLKMLLCAGNVALVSNSRETKLRKSHM
jgi:predicted TIM-barrel enzyme